LLVWVLRSFIIQPYRVPTGSLEPTILPGDFIAVSQFSYGLRLPLINTKFLPLSEPSRGDIALFRWPKNPNVVFIKRVVGLPGDHIVYRHKMLTINGIAIPLQFLQSTYDEGDGPGQKRLVFEMQENLMGVKHAIFVQPVGDETGDLDIVVPP